MSKASRRYLSGIIGSIVLIFVYLAVIFPATYFFHGENFLISSVGVESNNAVFVSHNLYGLVNLKTPAAKYAYVGGFPIAVALYTDGVIIDDIAAVDTAFGKTNPSSQLSKGDFLVELNGKKIDSVSDIDEILERINFEPDYGWKFSTKKQKRRNSKADYALPQSIEQDFQIEVEENSDKLKDIEAVFLRNGEKRTVKIKPALEEFSHKYRLGIVARDYILGVGTVSFIKEDGSFGAMGHPISDSVAGRVPIRGGTVFKCRENGVTKGERGTPGELKVKIGSMKNPIGVVSRNTDCGIFGKFDSVDEVLSGKNYAEKCCVDKDTASSFHAVSNRKQVSMGGAYICTSIDGTVDYYKAEIIRAINQPGFSDKGLVVRVTDQRLLEKSGGIVQGMSGSPIIQNNMIVGAVTHVFVNEPSKGFGIYADFMYDN